MQEVYLIMVASEERTKVCAVCTKEKAKEQFELIEYYKPREWVKEKVGDFNIKFYSLNKEHELVFEEQIYIQKRFLVS